MSGEKGPYEPTWTNRRRLTFLWLAFSAVSLSLDWVGVYDISEGIQFAIFTVCGLLITYYLIGPSWEGVQAFLAWKQGGS